MALNSKTCVACRNLALDAAFDVLDSGKKRIYDGTQPTDADTALAAQVLLADLAYGSDSFAAAAAGSKAANAITADASADATGTATWCSSLNGSNVRKYDGSAGTSSVNLTLNTASIVAAANVSISGWSFTLAV